MAPGDKGCDATENHRAVVEDFKAILIITLNLRGLKGKPNRFENIAAEYGAPYESFIWSWRWIERRMGLARRIFQRYYIPPVKVELEGHTYARGYSSYSDYNYLQPGIPSFMRVRHFEHALRLTSEYFHKANVIDFACADGPFLPSLSKYFNNVVAIDKNPTYIKLAFEVVRKMRLSNVELICNADLTLDVLKSKMPNHKYHILYLLETLEHIGDISAPWDSRAEFLAELFGLVEKNGIIVISVPNVVGMPFLLQRVGLFLLKQQREPISMADLLRASLFSDTTNLEKQRHGGHLGFNHKKLENRLRKDFKIVRKKKIISQVIYILAARST